MGSQTVLLATEKPFSASAVKAIRDALPGYTLVELQGYSDRAQLLQAAASAEAAIVRSDKCDAEFFAHAKNLKILVRAGTGVDTIDLEAAKTQGVVVMNTPGQNSNAVAELAFGMMISHIRSHFDGGMGSELRGKSLCLHGCGNVSRYMITLAKVFRMSVTAFDPYLTPEQIRAAGAEPAANVQAVTVADQADNEERQGSDMDVSSASEVYLPSDSEDIQMDVDSGIDREATDDEQQLQVPVVVIDVDQIEDDDVIFLE